MTLLLLLEDAAAALELLVIVLLGPLDALEEEVDVAVEFFSRLVLNFV